MGHKKEAARPETVCAAVGLVGLSGCQRCCHEATVCCRAVGQLSGCHVRGPDSDGTPLMSGSAVRLSETCCQTVGESAVSAVRLSGTVRRCPGFAVRLSDQGSEIPGILGFYPGFLPFSACWPLNNSNNSNKQ